MEKCEGTKQHMLYIYIYMKYIKIGDYSTHEKTRDSMSIYLDLARQRRLGMGNGFSLQLLSYRKSLPTS